MHEPQVGAASVAPIIRNRRATIICDASFCHRTKAGGWAVWITSSVGFNLDKQTHKQAGTFHRSPRSPEQAEGWACYNGLWLAYRIGANSALVQTDCLNVVNGSGRPDWNEMVGLYWPDMQVAWRHVKGHTDRPESRFYINRWCDETAKTHMKRQRHERDRRQD